VIFHVWPGWLLYSTATSRLLGMLRMSFNLFKHDAYSAWAVLVSDFDQFLTVCCRMYDRLNNASGALYWRCPKTIHNYGSNSGWYMGTQLIQLCIPYMCPIWVPPCIHLGQPIWDSHGSMLHPPYGSFMGSPYGPHILCLLGQA